MSRSIYKYVLKIQDEQTVEMPGDAYPLCIQDQGGIPCLWAAVEPKGSKQKHKIVMHGTGEAIADDEFSDSVYLGTWQQGDGLVWHFFEVC